GMARAQQHIDGLVKPPGSLGRLETLAVQLAGLPGLQGQLALAEKAMVVMLPRMPLRRSRRGLTCRTRWAPYHQRKLLFLLAL
ncbi:nicotinate-nucleotide--dimethylbenzimidazole phosphoribosyltransferase, partial [Mycobacterium tuberculosis]|nr:nicotinate-nucleotide--dimethylbenzimidazole phosphoribosyltransferase [Mycobacterium tuberculosis]